MCTDGAVGGGLPGGEALSVAAALRVMDAALDYLNGPGVREIEAAGLGGVLEALAGLGGKLAAARAAALARFDAGTTGRRATAKTRPPRRLVVRGAVGAGRVNRPLDPPHKWTCR